MGESFRLAGSYNAGDSKSVADLYTDDAEFIDEHGDRIQGRPVIQDFTLRSSSKAREPRSHPIDSLAFFGPDVAKKGAHFAQAGWPKARIPAPYTVLFVKQGGQWRYSSVAEEHETYVSHHDRLKGLEWLVGDWLDQSPDSTVHATCRWSEDKNFLLRNSYHPRPGPARDDRLAAHWLGSLDQAGQIVGVRLRGRLRQRALDGDKGQWIIKSTGVLPDGRIATATNTLTRVSPNRVTWSAAERTVGGEGVPDSRVRHGAKAAPPSII